MKVERSSDWDDKRKTQVLVKKRWKKETEKNIF